MTNSIARVRILDIPLGADCPYDYFIPEELREAISCGSIVVLPFGKNNRKVLAVVTEITGRSDYSELKPVLEKCDGAELSSEMLGLALYISEHCFCTVGAAVGLILPSMVLTKAVSGKKIETVKSERMVSLALPSEDVISLTKYGAKGRITGEKQINVINELTGRETAGAIRFEELKSLTGASSSTLFTLEKKGIIRIERKNCFGDRYVDRSDQYENSDRSSGLESESELSSEQKKASDSICELLDSGEPKAALLYGVTGSGKTRVIMSAIDHVIRSKKQAIVLVPEISLTPQTVGVFKAHYGSRIAVIHSQLSQGERQDAWIRMKSGEVDVCIGTRSAVFAPLSRLGLIVIDEEQEHTYKSDMSPKYHARDIARYRCAKSSSLMLLASATPSIESFYKAKSGIYSLITLKERYGNARLPEAVICDLRPDTGSGNFSPIGSELRKRLSENLEKNDQSILFINRRGYNSFLSCPLCGGVLTCKRCSVSYTYHIIKEAGDGYLMCHYCGAREPVPKKCPECGNEHLRYIGYGTQTVEKEIERILPSARVVRMDADTTSAKFAYDDIIKDFRNGKQDILLGTQMVTKGHDFPDVTLVGVINADSALYMSDYRSNERTFSLITQVIGRCGRSDKPGTALIQTYSPEHPVLKMAADQKYDIFYENEIASRKALVFPPFCDIALILLSSKDEPMLNKAAKELSDKLKSGFDGMYRDVSLVIFGPIEPPVYKINETFRLQFVIKCRTNKRTREFLRKIVTDHLAKKTDVSISVDINPNSL